MHKAIRTIIPLFVLCAVLVGYSYTSGQWSEPTAAPTGGNVPAPLNAGPTAQTKTGSLIIDGTLDASNVIAHNIAIGVCPATSHGSCAHPHETFALPATNNFRWNIGGVQQMAMHGDGWLWVRDRVQTNRMQANQYCDNAGNCFNPTNVLEATTQLYQCPVINSGSWGHNGCYSTCMGQITTQPQCRYLVQSGGNCNVTPGSIVNCTPI